MKPFLTAAWKNLLFINYETDAKLLQTYLPKGVEVDEWQGKCFVSLVGFMFLNTKIRGIGFPFHRNFEEFNLRFYVRRKQGNEWKRGVVFVKEIVPRRMISSVAYLLYGERYFYCPMKNSVTENDNELDVSYSFFTNKKWQTIQAVVAKQSAPLQANTEEEFITEHYWGYTRLAENKTSEYQVDHPRWNIHQVLSYKAEVDTEYVYGSKLQACFAQKPSSVFMAAGSPVTVFTRNLINF